MTKIKNKDNVVPLKMNLIILGSRRKRISTKSVVKTLSLLNDQRIFQI